MQTPTTTIVTNPDTGVVTIITRTVISPHAHFHYGLLLLAIIASALIACGLRMIFWNKESN